MPGDSKARGIVAGIAPHEDGVGVAPAASEQAILPHDLRLDHGLDEAVDEGIVAADEILKIGKHAEFKAFKPPVDLWDFPRKLGHATDDDE